jgi:hypothetical protein
LSAAPGPVPGRPFAASAAQFDKICGFLGGEAAAGLQHFQLEGYLKTEGFELLRLLLQGHSAPRGALSYPLPNREGPEEMSLGLMAYPDSKVKGDNSMPENRPSCPGVRGDGPGGPRDMAKSYTA